MHAFVIHRTTMRNEAHGLLTSLGATHGMYIVPFFLKKSYGSKWKQQASSNIYSSEIVVVFDSEACSDSENTRWEIEQAIEIGKPIVELSRADISSRNIEKLQAAYNFSEEFDECFEDHIQDSTQLLELYKIMVETSEELIRRRQITNGFFITIISAIIAASGFVVKEIIVDDNSAFLLLVPIIVGLLMCRSWGNLIENYGKLNKGKFRVIHKIECKLPARIFAAEWVALGKGVRKEKYQSFTNTEQSVPKIFSYLLWAALLLTLYVANWDPISNRLLGIWATGKQYVFTADQIPTTKGPSSQPSSNPDLPISTKSSPIATDSN